MGKLVRKSFAFWLLLGFTAFIGINLVYRTIAGTESVRESRIFFLDHALKASRPLVKAGRAHELSKYLRDSVSTGLIDFYEISQSGKVEIQGRNPNYRPTFMVGLAEEQGWIWGQAEGDEIKLSLASGVGWQARLASAWAEELQRLPVELGLFIFVYLAFYLLPAKTAERPGVEASMPIRLRGRKKAQPAASPSNEGSNQSDFSGVCLRANVQTETDSALLEDFFTKSALLVGRYKGKVHSIQGQEFICYFSEEEAELSVRLALAAARDLEAIAGGAKLVVHLALASGLLHQTESALNSALFGEPLRETAKLLEAMSGSKSTLWASADAVKLAGEHFQFRAPSSEPKGLKPKVLVKTTELEKVIGSCKHGNSGELLFHRSDESLLKILRSLQDSDWSREAYVKVIQELREAHFLRCGPEISEAFGHLFQTELDRRDSYRVSSLLSLAPNLFERNHVAAALEKLFLRAVAVPDSRIRANAVELFTRLFPEREIPQLRSLLRDEDHRVSANALIKMACERFDEKVISRLEERLVGGSVAHVASALHAAGEIALYYRTNDPLFLGTKLSFLRIFNRVPEWAEHPNPMIRRQALIAAKKLNSKSLEARLRETFEKGSDPELVALFSSVYGWKKDSEGKAA